MDNSKEPGYAKYDFYTKTWEFFWRGHRYVTKTLEACFRVMRETE